MADEDHNNHEGLNRRSFLKSAGVVVAGGTLGAGSTLEPEAATAAQAAPATITNFQPISGARSTAKMRTASRPSPATSAAAVPIRATPPPSWKRLT